MSDRTVFVLRVKYMDDQTDQFIVTNWHDNAHYNGNDDAYRFLSIHNGEINGIVVLPKLNVKTFTVTVLKQDEA